MHLQMPLALATRYRSPSQRARVVSEAWARENLYCARCTSPVLHPLPPNSQVADFICPQCEANFQIKSQSRPFSTRVCDSAFEPMRRAVAQGRAPNLLALHYDPAGWAVRNLLFVPAFALTLSSLEKRRPLGPHARRKGWVGCNILLTSIPQDARIALILQGKIITPTRVRQL